MPQSPHNEQRPFVKEPAHHYRPPLGIDGRPDQTSIDPGASFQFGRTSTRRPLAAHLAAFGPEEGTSV